MKNYVKILKREMLKIKEDFIEGYNESEANTKTTPTIKTSVSFKEVDDSKGTYIFCTNIESDVLNNTTTIDSLFIDFRSYVVGKIHAVINLCACLSHNHIFYIRLSLD